MDDRLLHRYFRDECTPEECDKVQRWLQTQQGRAYLEEQMDVDFAQFAEQQSGGPVLSEMDSQRIFADIRRDRKDSSGPDWRWWLGIAASIVIIAATTIVAVQSHWVSELFSQPERSRVVYQTKAGEQKKLVLADGTKIRLNENSKLALAIDYNKAERTVELNGEALFDVTHQPAHPFAVKVNGFWVRDIGTVFNVREDTVAQRIQVAVKEGRVSLRSSHTGPASETVLTKDHFGTADFNSDVVTVEKGSVANYLSWISNRLQFSNASLGQISRQLARLYNVSFSFEDGALRKKQMTGNIERADIHTVVNVIAHTLDISVTTHGRKIQWSKME